MRILQVAHGFPPYEWAGTELVTCTLSQALQARGHQVTVLARTDQPAAPEFSLYEERFAGVDVIRVVNTYAQISTFRLHYDNPFVTEPFLEVLQRCRPDVVHFQHVAHLSVNVLSLAAARGYPVVLSLHDFFFACHRVHLIDDLTRLCPGPERGERCVSCLHAETTPD
jgi:glycosyltransferase involved in cell wall biosynthesis